MHEAKPEAYKKEVKTNLLVPLAILTCLIFAWLLYVYSNRSWLAAFQQVASWLSSPTVNYTPTQVEAIPAAFLATLEILFLGASSSYLLLPNEKDPLIKLIAMLGLGTGLTGLITIVLGVFWNLYQLQLNIAILLLGAIFLSISFCKKKGKAILSPLEYLKNQSAKMKFRRPSNFGMWLLTCIAIGAIFFFIFYHALSTVITHWDAIVYHAVMPVFMYNNHGIPVIAGPSLGIEMSANFPPLFPALGAYYYTQIGLIEDFYLRGIPPVMGILTVLATYKIGETLAGKRYGIVSALFLTITPLFFRYSTFATSYSTLSFFGTVSVLFLFLAMKKADGRYWISCGIFYGFALLTSYLSLYLAPFFIIALIYYFSKERNGFKVNLRIAVLFISSALFISGVWYLRNLVLVGNPIYPTGYTVLGGVNIDPLIMETTLRGLKRSATWAFFESQTGLVERAVIFLTYRTHFPSISLLTILGTILVAFQSRKFWLILAWPSILTIIILSGITWGFPRHLVFTLPGFALLSALPIAKALEKCEKHDQTRTKFNRTGNKILHPKKTDLLRIGIIAVLTVAFIFPSLTLSMGGKVGMDNLEDEPRDNYLWFLQNPNAEKWLALDSVYIEAKAWRWLNEKLNEGEKVATIENRIYYIKNCSNDYIFYLDGWEARDLYNITDLTEILQYLSNKNVKYVLDVDWAHEHGHLQILPLAKLLGTPFFPQITYGGAPRIYSAWSTESSEITVNSTLAAAVNQEGWTKPFSINGTPAIAVIPGSNDPRFCVATTNLTSVKLTYLDSGTDKLSIYLYNQYSEEWLEYTFIYKTNTEQWKTKEFLAPVSKNEYTLFALHTYKEDFTVSSIEAAQLHAPGKTSLYSLDNEMTNVTNPPSLMVHLPILNEGEKIQIQTDSLGKEVCIEIFEGVIQPWENTEWWKHHELAARSPNSITDGQIDPSLTWNVQKTGFYTIVVVLRDFFQDNKVNMEIFMGEAKVPVRIGIGSKVEVQ